MPNFLTGEHKQLSCFHKQGPAGRSLLVCTQARGTAWELRSLRRLLMAYRNLYLPATQGTAGMPSPAAAASQQGLHSHPLFLSKRSQGRSCAPQPAAQVYQLSHPDLQIINEPAAPTGSWGGGTYLQQAGELGAPAHPYVPEEQSQPSSCQPG